ncbi:hypothetical protein ACQ86O_15455 [Serratia sp. L9]|uniref:hypothetical protein n=1 Tax=Serratia sp. L9 TaxID=3423946 RepID=UPI003D679BAA
MSKIITQSSWAPPLFPSKGRLPDDPSIVQANYEQQQKQVRDFGCQMNMATGRKNPLPCSQSLHISLFFDGTNNNDDNDTAAKPPHPTNIARLYHATIKGPQAEQSGFFLIICLV